MGRFLCKIGFHDWQKLGVGDLTMTSAVYRCKRRHCGIRKFVSLLGVTIIEG
jgi:hypothetical protein